MGNQRFSITPALAVKDERVSDSVFRTLAALGVYGDDHGWCWPSYSTLGKLLHKSKQAVGRDIKILEALGYIQISPRYSSETGARRSNKMRILFDNQYPPSIPEVDGASIPEVDGASIPEVDDNVPVERPKERSSSEDDDIFRVYEHITGRLVTGGYQPDELRDMESQFPIEWIRDAFGKAVNAGARNPIGYAWTCLNDWKLKGHPSAQPEYPGSGGLVYDEATGEFRV